MSKVNCAKDLKVWDRFCACLDGMLDCESLTIPLKDADLSFFSGLKPNQYPVELTLSDGTTTECVTFTGMMDGVPQFTRPDGCMDFPAGSSLCFTLTPFNIKSILNNNVSADGVYAMCVLLAEYDDFGLGIDATNLQEFVEQILRKCAEDTDNYNIGTEHSIERNIIDRIIDEYSTADFGAIRDGSATTHNQLSNMAEDLCHIRFLEGEYVIDRPIRLVDETFVDGLGCKAVVSGGQNHLNGTALFELRGTTDVFLHNNFTFEPQGTSYQAYGIRTLDSFNVRVSDHKHRSQNPGTYAFANQGNSRNTLIMGIDSVIGEGSLLFKPQWTFGSGAVSRNIVAIGGIHRGSPNDGKWAISLDGDVRGALFAGHIADQMQSGQNNTIGWGYTIAQDGTTRTEVMGWNLIMSRNSFAEGFHIEDSPRLFYVDGFISDSDGGDAINWAWGASSNPDAPTDVPELARFSGTIANNPGERGIIFTFGANPPQDRFVDMIVNDSILFNVGLEAIRVDGPDGARFIIADNLIKSGGSGATAAIDFRSRTQPNRISGNVVSSYDGWALAGSAAGQTLARLRTYVTSDQIFQGISLDPVDVTRVRSLHGDNRQTLGPFNTHEAGSEAIYFFRKAILTDVHVIMCDAPNANRAARVEFGTCAQQDANGVIVTPTTGPLGAVKRHVFPIAGTTRMVDDETLLVFKNLGVTNTAEGTNGQFYISVAWFEWSGD